MAKKVFTQKIGKYEFSISIDTEDMLKHFDEEIVELNKTIESGYDADYDNGYSIVNGDMDELAPISECIEELERMKDCAKKLDIDGDSHILFEMIPLKKNGTFNRSTKPIIRTRCFGLYLTDCYGWETEVIRIVPTSDTTAEVVVDNIIVHY